MSRFHTIVAAVDFSETSRDALDLALELAHDSAGRVRLIHVVPDAPRIMEAPGVDMQQIKRTWIEEAEAKIAKLTADRAADAPRIRTAVLAGPAAREIVHYADDHAADILVLGSHGHGRIQGFLLGSVADGVIRRASCPVLMVPHRVLRSEEAQAQHQANRTSAAVSDREVEASGLTRK